MHVPVVAAKPLGDSSGGDCSYSNVAVHVTELTLPPVDGFGGEVCSCSLGRRRGASSLPVFL